MYSKGLSWTVSVIAILVLAAAGSAVAQPPPSVHLSGFINDYTAAIDATATPPKLIGPWEIRGEWNLRLQGDSGKADFSAALTMEYSDYWLLMSGLSDPSTRSAHTHHIIMTDAIVSYDTTDCPKYSPATTTGFVVAGMANVTGNGKPAPFEGNDPYNPILSPLQVCITGSLAIPYSNITLVFSNPASGHFGSQAIHGAVRNSNDSNQDD